MKSLDSKTPNQDWHPNIWPPFTQINKSQPQIEVTHGKDALLFTKGFFSGSLVNKRASLP